MKIKPLNDFVILKGEETVEVTDSGIYLPEKKDDTPITGYVEDWGSEWDGITLPKGTKVWYKMWAGEDVLVEGVKYRLVHKKDLIAFFDYTN